MHQLLAMLRREDELRRSDETLALFKQGDINDYNVIIDALQAQVAREFGMEAALCATLLRTADRFARSDTELAQIVAASLYRRHNRCFDGTVHVGDTAPILRRPLHLVRRPSGGAEEELELVPLFPYMLQQQPHADPPPPLVLFAGSYS